MRVIQVVANKSEEKQKCLLNSLTTFNRQRANQSNEERQQLVGFCAFSDCMCQKPASGNFVPENLAQRSPLAITSGIA
jgi:hypothetical protein